MRRLILVDGIRSNPWKMKRFWTACLFGLAASVVFAQQTWRRSIGGWGPDEAAAAKERPDGSIVVVGSTGSFGAPAGDVYVFVLSATGELLWSRMWGTNAVDVGEDVEIVEGGFLVAGYSNGTGHGGYDGVLTRMDDQGNVLWSRSYGTEGWDMIREVSVGTNGLYLVGTTYGTTGGDADLWVVHTDLEGNEIWERSFGTDFDDAGWGCATTADGGCVVVGEFGGTDGLTDGVLHRLDQEGDLLWQVDWPGAESESAHDVIEAQGGGFIMAGITNSVYPFQQILLSKVTDEGEVQWTNSHGLISDWEAWDVQEQADGDILVAASTSSSGSGGWDMYLLITDPDGAFEGGRTYGGIEDEKGRALAHCADGGVVLAGSSTSYGPGIESAFVIKGDTAGFTYPETVQVLFDPVSIPETAAPVPYMRPTLLTAGGTVYLQAAPSDPPVTMALLDAAGRILRTGPVHGEALPMTAVPAGAYLLEVRTRSGQTHRQRIVVQ